MRKMLMLFLFALLVISLAVPGSAASPSRNICLNNTVLQRNVTTVTDTNGALSNVTEKEDIFCPYGCNNVTMECYGNNTNLDYGFIVMAGLISIGAFMVVLAWMVKEKHIMISFVFFFMTIINMMLIAGTAAEISRDAGRFTIATIIDGLVLPIGIIMFVSVLYFFISWLISTARYMKDRKEEKIVGP